MRPPSRICPSVRVAVALVALLASAVLVAGCAEGETPGGSPTAGDVARDTAAAGATAEGTQPLPTLPPGGSPVPPVDTTAGAPAAGEREAVAGAAVEALAEWTGEPPSQFRPELVEEAAWTDACLDVERPDIACAEVITPGWRVVLRDALGGTHEVRTDRKERLAWAPQAMVSGTVVEVDAAAGRLVVRSPAGDIALRRVPGTVAVFSDFAPGVEVVAAYDPSPTEGAAPVLVWATLP